MPSRSLISLILLAWIGVTGWFVARDFWPRLNSDGAPLYDVSFLDEIKGRTTSIWLVTEKKNGNEQRYLHRSQTGYREVGDQFEYEISIRRETIENAAELRQQLIFETVQLAYLRSLYSCTREGRLVDFEIEARYDLTLLGLHRTSLRTSVSGVADDNHLDLRYSPPTIGSATVQRESFPVSYARRVLIPLHPPSQMKGLRTGQRWRVPYVDLFSQAPRKTGSTKPLVEWLEAEVLPVSTIDYNGRKFRCRVVEYKGKTTRARYYVEQNLDASVVQFQLQRGDETWTMDRIR